MCGDGSFYRFGTIGCRKALKTKIIRQSGLTIKCHQTKSESFLMYFTLKEHLSFNLYNQSNLTLNVNINLHAIGPKFSKD